MATRRAREAQIIAAAAELFAAHGFAAVGIDDIGAAVGLSGPAVYRYFPSKDALLESLVSSTTAAMVENLSVFESISGSADPTALLRTAAEIALDHRASLATAFREQHRLSPRVAWELAEQGRKMTDLSRLALERFNPGLDDAAATIRLRAVAGFVQAVMGTDARVRRPWMDGQLVASNIAVFCVPAEPVEPVEPERRSPGWRPAPTRRDLIVEAAMPLMARRGFHEVQSKEIAEAAGVPPRSLYREYEHKLAILVEGFERFERRLWSVREEVLARAKTADDVVQQMCVHLAQAILRDVPLARVAHRERRAIDKGADLERFSASKELRSLWVEALREVRPELDADQAGLLVSMAVELLIEAGAAAAEPWRANEVAALAQAHLAS